MILVKAIIQNNHEVGHPIFGAEAIVRDKRIIDILPSGSGFDNGTDIEFVSSKKIIFKTAFHHMDDNGYYCGWTEHKVIIEADFWRDLTIRVTGVNKREIKSYISDIFALLMYSEFEYKNI